MVTKEKGLSNFGPTIRTPQGVLYFPSLTEPDTEGKYATGKYKTTIIFSKDTDLTNLKQAIVTLAKAHWPSISLKELKVPFKKGNENVDDNGDIREGFHDTTYMHVNSKNKPQIVSRNPNIPYEGLVYGGTVAILSVTPLIYTVEEGKGPNKKVDRGVTFKLNNVQVIKEATWKRSASNDFDSFEDEEVVTGFESAPDAKDDDDLEF